MEKTKSTTGLKKETLAALAVLFSPSVVIPVVILLLEKDEFVRINAVQSTIVFIIAAVLSTLLVWTIFLPGILWIIWFILWLIQVYKAWQGEEFQVPLIHKYSKILLSKI